MSELGRLEARVRAANRAHEWCNKLHPLFLAALRPFVGKKVVKADGYLTEAVKKALPETPNTVATSVMFDRAGGTLRWEVKTMENIADEAGCLYFTASFSCGQLALRGDTLEEVFVGECGYRTDHTAAEVKAQREEVKRLQKLADEAKSKLHPFGMQDF